MEDFKLCKEFLPPSFCLPWDVPLLTGQVPEWCHGPRAADYQIKALAHRPRTIMLGNGNTTGGGVGGFKAARLGRCGMVGSSSQISITSTVEARVAVSATGFDLGFSTRRSSVK